MNRISMLLVLLLAATANAANEQPTPKPQKPQPDKIVVYKTIGDVELTLHLFFPPDYKTTDHRPAIVFFFGGGWVKGNPSLFYRQCAALSSRGMVAMSADYRIRNIHHTTPIECVKDGKSAIRWIRSHAAELGIDPDKLAAGGGSAGGQVAAATGTVKGFNEEGEDTTVSCRPNALVLFNPVIDNGPDGYGYDRVADYWREFSPINNIDGDAPPTSFFLGTNDKYIPVATAETYKRLMNEAGVRCDLYIYEGKKHAFYNFGDGYEQTLRDAERFLTSLGYLSENPAPPPADTTDDDAN